VIVAAIGASSSSAVSVNDLLQLPLFATEFVHRLYVGKVVEPELLAACATAP
jgi:hypothetical protein